MGNARQARQRAVLLEGVSKLDDARHVITVVGESVGAQAASRQQAKDEHCQRLLTVGFEVWGGVLERLKGRVCLERLRQRLCTVLADPIGLEAANKSQTEVSAAADS